MFRSTLRADRLVKIYIGERTPRNKPFLIQQSVLEHASAYFKKAFENEHKLGAAEAGTLSFPEDDTDAWIALLQWMLKHSLPDSWYAEPHPNVMTKVRCWALGEKYMIPEFQDLVMLELLATLNHNNSPGIEVVKVGFELTPPGCKLRVLLAEEVAAGLTVHKSLTYDELDMCDGVTGFAGEVGKAISLVHARELEKAISLVHRISRAEQRRGRAQDEASSSRWREFMVGGGPKEHWILRRQE